jgi:hypothetical protein
MMMMIPADDWLDRRDFEKKNYIYKQTYTKLVHSKKKIFPRG